MREIIALVAIATLYLMALTAETAMPIGEPEPPPPKRQITECQ